MRFLVLLSIRLGLYLMRSGPKRIRTPSHVRTWAGVKCSAIKSTESLKNLSLVTMFDWYYKEIWNYCKSHQLGLHHIFTHLAEVRQLFLLHLCTPTATTVGNSWLGLSTKACSSCIIVVASIQSTSVYHIFMHRENHLGVGVTFRQIAKTSKCLE